jgi:hypothetical protein
MAVISQYDEVNDGDTITAALWNGMEQNLINNGLVPSGIEDYSATDGQMQTQVDPYPGSATSRPTSLQGELERMRYQLAQITGKTYWYQDPDTNIAAMAGSFFPAGTALVFFQAAAPTGWTQSTAHNDKAIRIVSSAGGGSGGTHGLSSPPSTAHTHTISSSDISHYHRSPIVYGTASTALYTSQAYGSEGDATGVTPLGTSAAAVGAQANTQFAVTAGMSSNSTHSHGGATASASPTAFAPTYIDCIVCTKD